MSLEQTVYIVDDNEAIRNSLSLLMKSTGMAIKEYASAEAFLEDYHPDNAGCLVAGVRMQGMSGLDLQKTLAEKQACVSVIIMTSHGDVDMAVKAMKAGAVDFVEKPFQNQDLLGRIQACLFKSKKFFVDCKQRSVVIERLALLSDREREVMELLVDGKQNKQIAAELSISTRTVEVHRAKVMEKLQANSLPDVVRMSMLV
ncbi:MAG: response regulator [Gammaproteobacteria bacterium]|jgi:two-component system, LuxR family, response regulator FixJ